MSRSPRIRCVGGNLANLGNTAQIVIRCKLPATHVINETNFDPTTIINKRPGFKMCKHHAFQYAIAWSWGYNYLPKFYRFRRL